MTGLHVLDTAIAELRVIVDSLEQDIKALDNLVANSNESSFVDAMYAASALKALLVPHRRQIAG